MHEPWRITDAPWRLPVRAKFDEAKHPRDPDGKFGDKVGVGGVFDGPVYDMSDDAVTGMRSYQGGQVFASVKLRENTTISSGAAAHIAKMDAAMNAAGPVGGRVSVYRGVSAQGKAALGVSDPRDLIGRTVVDRGFASTTTDDAIARQCASLLAGDDGDVLWQLDVEPDVKAVYMPRVDGAIAMYASQKELVLQRGARWDVTDARVEGSRWIISATVRPPDADSAKLPPVKDVAPVVPPSPLPKPKPSSGDSDWGDLA
jgi:hypothetical protein